MPYRLANRAKMTVSSAPSTGDITLGAAVTDAVNGDAQTFANAGILGGDTIRYWVVDGNNWGHERGLYRSTSTQIVGRENLSSITGSLISLSSATQVFIDPANRDLQEIAMGQPLIMGQL